MKRFWGYVTGFILFLLGLCVTLLTMSTIRVFFAREPLWTSVIIIGGLFILGLLGWLVSDKWSSCKTATSEALDTGHDVEPETHQDIASNVSEVAPKQEVKIVEVAQEPKKEKKQKKKLERECVERRCDIGVVKIVLISIGFALIIGVAYLHCLNSRYVNVSSGSHILDKWSGKIYYSDDGRFTGELE